MYLGNRETYCVIFALLPTKCRAFHSSTILIPIVFTFHYRRAKLCLLEDILGMSAHRLYKTSRGVESGCRTYWYVAVSLAAVC